MRANLFQRFRQLIDPGPLGLEKMVSYYLKMAGFKVADG